MAQVTRWGVFLRRDCHFDGTPSPSILKHLLTKGRGRCIRMTEFSPTATRWDMFLRLAPDVLLLLREVIMPIYRGPTIDSPPLSLQLCICCGPSIT